MNKNIDLLENEKIKIKKAFNQKIHSYEKYNIFFKIGTNHRHFVELVSNGHTLFTRYYLSYDDSLEESYLQIGILNSVLIDGNKDIFSPEIIEIASKIYTFSIIENNTRWVEKNGRDVFYTSENLVEFWMLEFMKVLI